MQKGTVLSIDVREGKGFIKAEDGSVIMFLLSSVIGDMVEEEEKVSYDIVEDPELQAVNVQKA